LQSLKLRPHSSRDGSLTALVVLALAAPLPVALLVVELEKLLLVLLAEIERIELTELY